MQYGFVVPWADAGDVADLAAAAEESGWDGLFVWEPIWGVDAWISLGLAAVRTSRIRLGTMLTAPSRRRPWELASQVATVDRLSGGRTILSVGLGALDSGFESFGEVCDRHTRAQLLDECLEIVTGLWQGQPFEFAGEHYNVSPTEFPTMGDVVQIPRVPIWCVGALGHPRSMARAMQWDGLIPQVVDADGARQATLDEIAGLSDLLGPPSPERPFDVIIEGIGSDHSPAAWSDAGATWWIESMWGAVSEVSAVAAATDRLREGPPGP